MFYGIKTEPYKQEKKEPKKWFINLFFWIDSTQKRDNIASTTILKTDHQFFCEPVIANQPIKNQGYILKTQLLYKDLNTIIHSLMFEKNPDIVGALITIATEVQKMQDELNKIQDDLDHIVAEKSVLPESVLD